MRENVLASGLNENWCDAGTQAMPSATFSSFLYCVLLSVYFAFTRAHGGPEQLHTYIVPGSLLWICLILSGPSRNHVITLCLYGLTE